MVPFQREVAVRCIQWIQSTVSRQVEHGQAIAALFGRMNLEKEDTVDEQGRLIEFVNYHARILFGDLQYLKNTLAAEGFYEAREEFGMAITPLLMDEY